VPIPLPRVSKTAIIGKPLYWIGSSKHDLRDMPGDIQDVFGRALLDLQFGDTPTGAKSFGEGLPAKIMKLSDDHAGNTYRAAYTVAFANAVYVLDVFMKKSKAGISTPKAVRNRVKARYDAARLHDEETHGE
jgi:phage-related protein